MCCFSLASGKEIGDGFGFDQLAWLFQVVVNDRLGGNAERVVNRGQQFHRVDGVLGGAAGGLV